MRSAIKHLNSLVRTLPHHRMVPLHQLRMLQGCISDRAAGSIFTGRFSIIQPNSMDSGLLLPS